jgi:hypothetical protein
VPVIRLNGQAAPTFVYRLPTDSMPVTFQFYDSKAKLLATVASTDTNPTPAAGGPGGGRGFGAAAPAKPSNRKGVNRYTWTMRHPDATTFRGMILWGGRGTGPSMAPGTYSVKMTAGSAAPVQYTFVVKPDPRSEATEADLVEQTRMALQVRDRMSDANKGVIEIRNLKTDVTDRTTTMTANAAFALRSAQVSRPSAPNSAMPTIVSWPNLRSSKTSNAKISRPSKRRRRSAACSLERR